MIVVFEKGSCTSDSCLKTPLAQKFKIGPQSDRDLELLPLITHIISINTCLTCPFRLFGNTGASEGDANWRLHSINLQLNCRLEAIFSSHILQLKYLISVHDENKILIIKKKVGL